MRLSHIVLPALLLLVVPSFLSVAQETPPPPPAPEQCGPSDPPPPPPVIRRLPSRDAITPLLPEGVATETFDLKYLSPEKLGRLMQFFMVGEVFTDEDLKVLAVRGTPEGVEKARQLVQKYDVPKPPQRLEVRIYQLTAAANGTANLTTVPSPGPVPLRGPVPPRRPQPDPAPAPAPAPAQPEVIEVPLRPLPPQLQPAAAKIAELYGEQQLGLLSVTVAQTQERNQFAINGAVQALPALAFVAEGEVQMRQADGGSVADLEISFRQESQQVRTKLEMAEGEYLVLAQNNSATSQPVWIVVGVQTVR